MKARRSIVSALLPGAILLALLIPAGSVHPPEAHARSASQSATVLDSGRISDAPDATPLMFIENVGQFDSDVRFQLPGGDRTIWLADDAIWVTLTGQPAEPVAPPHRAGGQVLPTLTESSDIQQPDQLTLKLSFVGANPHVRVEPINRLETHVSYFIGADPSSWRSDVPVWGGVRYAELYPGIDLELSGEHGGWTWHVEAREGAHTKAVRLQVDGAEKISLDGDRLRLGTGVGDFVLPLMGIEGMDAEEGLVPPRVAGNQVTAPFARQAPTAATIGTADASADLLYATFLGGGDLDYGWDIAVDPDGSAYVTGETISSDFPAALGPGYDTSYNGYPDVFVVKLNPSGTGLVYATFLGGSDSSGYGYGIAVDAGGSAYVTGFITPTSSFPAALGPGYDTSHNGGLDGFVVKLNGSGTALVYATFLGGSGTDYGWGIAVDAGGSAYVTGYTNSADFPAALGPGYDTSHNGGLDGFVVKLNPSGTTLVYATFLGGSSGDCGYGIAVDAGGSAYVTGYTKSADFPAGLGPGYDTSYNGGTADAFVVKLNPSGLGLVYATFLGGSDSENGYGIAVDAGGSAYVTGGTGSSDFPAALGPGYDTSLNGSGDAFVVKLNPGGTALVYATFLGGSGGELGWGVAVDAGGSAYVTGPTGSSDFPAALGPGYDTTHNGAYDAFVVKLAITYSVYPHGYSFDNASAHTSWEIFRDTFGTENVEWHPAGVTIRRLAAAFYYHNRYMCDGLLAGDCRELGSGGNCDGMAASSMLLYKGWTDPSDYLDRMGVATTYALIEPTITTDAAGKQWWDAGPVTDFIVRYQGYLLGGQVRAARSAAEGRSLADSLALLKGAIDGGLAEPAKIAIWGPVPWQNNECAGHTLMPYAYESHGATTDVYVYDSNLRGDDQQYISITPNTNSWSYNHNNSIGVWRSAQTCMVGPTMTASELRVYPLSVYQEHPNPPWLGGGLLSTGVQSVATAGWYELAVGSNGSLAIQDAQGRLVGNHNGQLVFEIPGSYLDIPLAVVPGDHVQYPEQYVISGTGELTVSLFYHDTGKTPFYGIVPGGQVEVVGASDNGGGVDTIHVAPDATQVNVKAGSLGDGRLMTLLREGSTYGREVTIGNFGLSSDATGLLEVDSTVDVVIFSSSEVQDSYEIDLSQVGATSSKFLAPGPPMLGGDIHTIRLDWDNPVTAAVEIDHDGDGTVDKIVVLDNQAGRGYLPIILR